MIGSWMDKTKPVWGNEIQGESQRGLWETVKFDEFDLSLMPSLIFNAMERQTLSSPVSCEWKSTEFPVPLAVIPRQ